MPAAATIAPVDKPKLAGWTLVQCPYNDCRGRSSGKMVTRVAPGYGLTIEKSDRSTSEEVCRSCHRKSYVTRRVA